MVAKVTFKGGPETARAFSQLADDVKNLEATHEKVARARLGGVSSRSPVDTGALAASWQSTGAATYASIISPLAYAPVHEYGSDTRGITASAMVSQTLEAEQNELLEEYHEGIMERAKSKGFRID